MSRNIVRYTSHLSDYAAVLRKFSRSISSIAKKDNVLVRAFEQLKLIYGHQSRRTLWKQRVNNMSDARG